MIAGCSVNFRGGGKHMQDGELTFGEVITGALDVLKAHWLPFVVYIAVISAIGLAIEVFAVFASDIDSLDFGTLSTIQEYLGFGAGLAGIAVFVLMVVAQYLLWETLMRREGLGSDPARHRYIAFFFQSLLITLLISIGTLLLVVPGLVFAARWAMAPALLIGDRQGLLQSMGSSWETIKGNTTPVALVVLVGAVAVYMTAGVLVFTTIGASVTNVQGFFFSAVQQVLGQLATVAFVALGVSLYRRAFGSSEAISEVFS